MTWKWFMGAGGETRDALIEGFYRAPSVGVGSPGIPEKNSATIITSPVKNGDGAFSTASGSTGPNMGAIANLWPNMLVQEAWVNLEAAPTAPFALLGSLPGGVPFIECDTSCRLRIGRYITNWAARFGQTPWSTVRLSPGQYDHLCLVLDPFSLGTAQVWAVLFVNFKPALAGAIDVTKSTTVFKLPCNLAAAGVAVRCDDLCCALSTNPADAPHLVRLPIGIADAQHPVSDTGCNLDWTRAPASGTWYSKWADATGNDGDTTYLTTNTTSKLQSSVMEDAATLGWAANAVPLEDSVGYGANLSVIHKFTAATKWAANTLCDLAAIATVPAPGAAYTGSIMRPVRSGGASWSRADVNAVKMGLQTAAANHDVAWVVTTMMVQWLYYEATLPLAPAPRPGRAWVPGMGYGQMI